MSFIFTFKLCGIGVKRGHLFGNKNHPAIFIKCLFFLIILAKEKTLGGVVKGVVHSTNVEEWLMTNAPQYRLFKKREEAKQRNYWKKWYESISVNWERTYIREWEKNCKLTADLYRAKDTIYTLNRLLSEKERKNEI